MKPTPEPEDDRTLNKVLRQWVVDAPLPPGFQDQVWQRIERAEPPPATFFWLSLCRLLETVIPRPRFAYSCAAMLLVVGMVAGAWAAQAQNTRTEASLGSRYLQSIDPYQAPAHRP